MLSTYDLTHDSGGEPGTEARTGFLFDLQMLLNEYVLLGRQLHTINEHLQAHVHRLRRRIERLRSSTIHPHDDENFKVSITGVHLHTRTPWPLPPNFEEARPARLVPQERPSLWRCWRRPSIVEYG